MGYPHYTSDCHEHWSIVTICGSMRFYPIMLSVAERLTLEGRFVLMPFVRKDGAMTPYNRQLQNALGAELSDRNWSIERFLDDMHKRKIELSEGVAVVSDASGYVGDSTRSEIEFAHRSRKPVRLYRQSAVVDEFAVSTLAHGEMP